MLHTSRRSRLDSLIDSSKRSDGYVSDISLPRAGYKLIEDEKSAKGKVGTDDS